MTDFGVFGISGQELPLRIVFVGVECWVRGVDDDRVGSQRCSGSKSDWHALCLQHETKKVSFIDCYLLCDVTKPCH